MNKSPIIIVLDNGHGSNTKGKLSPDGSLREYAYTREIVKMIYEALVKLGYKAFILVPEDFDVPLNTRVKRVNQIHSNNNKKSLLISIHCNAAGADGNWHNASGWSVFVAKNASSNSKLLAKTLKESASLLNLKIRVPSQNLDYWILSLAICRDTNCPAVLTENLFQDNREDVLLLLSKEGKKKIVDLHVNGIIKYLENK